MASSPPGLAARKAAHGLLNGVLRDGKSLSEQNPSRELSPAEAARATALVTTTLRHLPKIDARLDTFLKKAPSLPVLNILRLAAAELLADQVPAHAAVDSAVRLARGHKKTAHMSGLINAVARKLAQLPSEEFKAERPHPLPDWIRTRLVKSYGDAAVSNMEQVFAMDPPVDLTCKSPAAANDWATRLNAEVLPNGSVRLQGKGQISAMPGFAEGEWWVQDAAAAMPVALLGDLNGLRVLDMCAAPGGKTMQLAAANGAVTALDVSEARLARVAENLGRTNLTAQLVAADALKWSPDQSFDIVVLDAPCSATGTMRRHPDLVYLREGQDLAPVLSLQERLLQRAAEWTAPGGRLLYCSCSLFPEEGEEQIKAFLEKNKDFKCEAPNASWLEAGWVSREGFLRLRPDFWSDAKGMDGFFAAILHKI